MKTLDLKNQFGGLLIPFRFLDTEILHFEMLDHQTRLRQNTLYLGTLSQISRLSSSWRIEENASLIISDTTLAMIQHRPESAFAGCTFYSSAPLATLFNQIYPYLHSSSSSLPATWRQILSGRYNSTAEISQLLFSTTDEAYVQLLLVQPADTKVAMLPPDNLRTLSPIFEQDAFIALKKEVIILRRFEQQFAFPIPDSALPWLTQNHCIMAVGNATRDLSKIDMAYSMLNECLQIARILDRPGTVFPIDLYSSFLLIDHCFKDYAKKGSTPDVLFFAHPALIHLAYYDAAEHTNYRQLLYEYLQCGRSVSRTAEALYMHRNTVQNKLKKAAEIASLDLSDGILCQRLFLSCQIMEYAEKVLKQDVAVRNIFTKETESFEPQERRV